MIAHELAHFAGRDANTAEERASATQRAPLTQLAAIEEPAPGVRGHWNRRDFVAHGALRSLARFRPRRGGALEPPARFAADRRAARLWLGAPAVSRSALLISLYIHTVIRRIRAFLADCLLAPARAPDFRTGIRPHPAYLGQSGLEAGCRRRR
ncbi:hypothetical protein [Pseudomonas aeruginosa]|uniref:hypothetical protein n=1 Tax=Pseudomonas aeruginosa TaxID=287 RepID=UPI0021C19D2C|nr:hypothetical protein [Pseudomonas aeruginosa]UXH59033.1 hypothetical protein N5877_00060 [Pseudomonas aeruginosa]